jgi:hypothetical protein
MIAVPAVTRRVQVEALSAQTELLLVVRVAMAITVVVWTYVAFAGGGAAETPQRNLLPYQELMAGRPPDEQRMFRELQEGLIEAEFARSSATAWPSAEALRADGIPPFAPDPTRQVDYDWQLVQDGPYVNYVGIPRSAGAPDWLLVVQEPTPGVPPDQTFEDEEHHRLADGTMLHVSTWVRKDGRGLAPRVVRMPQAEGWTQLYAIGPSAASRHAPMAP